MDFWEFFWGMVAFFFFFTFIWIFIAVFADIFRRHDISGWAKAGWIFFIVVLPFLGTLIYMIARPPVTAEDVERMNAARAQGVGVMSPADEISKLAQLQESGRISPAEYESLKSKVIA